jgi:hypothetical protein
VKRKERQPSFSAALLSNAYSVEQSRTLPVNRFWRKSAPFLVRHKIGEAAKDSHVQQSNFTDYEVMRMSDLPNIEVRVVSTDNPPTGAGEDGTPLVAAAVGNAIFALTGKRMREIPFSPERVKGMLGA